MIHTNRQYHIMSHSCKPQPQTIAQSTTKQTQTNSKSQCSFSHARTHTQSFYLSHDMYTYMQCMRLHTYIELSHVTAPHISLSYVVLPYTHTRINRNSHVALSHMGALSHLRTNQHTQKHRNTRPQQHSNHTHLLMCTHTPAQRIYISHSLSK